jgi:hypothetical protein
MIMTCIMESEVFVVAVVLSRSAMNWLPEKNGWNKVPPLQFSTWFLWPRPFVPGLVQVPGT